MGQTTTEDIEMFVRNGLFNKTGRAAIVASVAAMTISAIAPTGVIAAPVAKKQARLLQLTAPAMRPISAARRRYYRGGGNAAGLRPLAPSSAPLAQSLPTQRPPRLLLR